MEFLVELLFEFFGEILLQVAFEAMAEAGLYSLRDSSRARANPLLAGIGYVIFGAIAGALSLWAFPSLFIAGRQARLANLAITPVIAGLAMMAIGAWRRKHDQEPIRLDKFAYGYLFAVTMGAVRFWFGD